MSNFVRSRDDDDERRERRAERQEESDWFNIPEYILQKGKWHDGSNETQRADICKSLIESIRNAGKNPLTYASELYNSTGNRDEKMIAKAKAKLIHRCLARQMKMSEECSGDDLDIAFSAMKVTDDDIINAANSMAGGGALHQVGGAFGLDLAVALLLRMTNMPQMNLAVLDAVLKTPEAFNQILGWANGNAVTGLAKMSDCLKSFLHIAAGQSYYDILTNQIAGIYYKGAEYATAGKEYADTFKSAFKTWLSTNPIDAIGFMAVAMRYPGNIINLTVKSINMASTVIASTAVGAAKFVGDFWASDAGVIVCVLIYIYERNREQFDTIIGSISDEAKNIFIAGINSLGAIETHIIKTIEDRKIISQLDALRERLTEFKNGLAKTDTANMTTQTLQIVAEIASKTSKLNFEANQAVIDTRIINTLTTALTTALNTEEAARVRHNVALAGKDTATRAHTDLVVAATLGQPPAPPGAMAMPGGKSRSRKLHKKVSASKRPKKSVHSRKAKVAKRSNKKH